MNVELPTTGCNIINNSTSFYNYSSDNKTRQYYIIYEGKAILQSAIYNEYGYNYTGTCLNTGDLIYKPELIVYFPVISFCLIIFTFYLAIKVVLGRLLR